MSKRPARVNGRFAKSGNGSTDAKPDVGGDASAASPDVGTVDNTTVIFDPSGFEGGDTAPVGSPDTTDEPGGEPARRKRGRPRGSRTGSAQQAKTGPINISGVEKLLLGIHNTLQAAFSVPELALDDSEAKELAKAYTDVAAFYPVMRLADNVTALVNLGSVVAIVYGSRISAWRFRKSMERKPPPPPRPDAALRAAPSPPQPGQAPREEPRRVPDEARVGEIPGVGNIVFPADHELMGGGIKKH